MYSHFQKVHHNVLNEVEVLKLRSKHDEVESGDSVQLPGGRVYCVEISRGDIMKRRVKEDYLRGYAEQVTFPNCQYIS
jgi:hypothetical protein